MQHKGSFTRRTPNSSGIDGWLIGPHLSNQSLDAREYLAIQLHRGFDPDLEAHEWCRHLVLKGCKILKSDDSTDHSTREALRGRQKCSGTDVDLVKSVRHLFLPRSQVMRAAK